MNVIKRNGTEVPFDISKIQTAITKANNSVPEEARMTQLQIRRITESVEFSCMKLERNPSVEEIQDMVEYQIMAHGAYEVSKNYITYRYTRSLVRRSNTTDDKILSLIDCSREIPHSGQDVSGSDSYMVNQIQRDYMAGEVSKDLAQRILLPKDIVDAHNEGLIHFHDMGYFVQHMHNCSLVNLEDMLQNGTVLMDTMIEKPHSFSTACTIATQIIAQAASNQYGGQTITLTHLAPFVDVSRRRIRESVLAENAELGLYPGEEQIEELTKIRLQEDIRRGVQTLQYQIMTLIAANGQSPFITVLMYLNESESEMERADLAALIEEVLRQRIQGVKNSSGEWVSPSSPKLIYVLEDDNASAGSKYWYLTELAAQCTLKRTSPEYISEKKMLEVRGDVCACMGRASFLSTDRFSDNGIGNIANAKNYRAGIHKYYGRFNQGTVTINLVDAALSSEGNTGRFWDILDERLELCYRALKNRNERLSGTLSDAAPIIWQHGSVSRLEKGEKIDRLLFNGFSTLSLGYAGLHECVKYMTGRNYTDPEGTSLALDIMQRMNECCAAWKKADNIDYVLYGVPLGKEAYRFAGCLKKGLGRFPASQTRKLFQTVFI